jgi:hypothetical protein
LVSASSDSGVTWSNQASNSQNWSVLASSEDAAVLVSAAYNGNINISTDFGVSWTELNSGPEGWSYVGLSADGTRLLASVGNGALFAVGSTTASGTVGNLTGSQNQTLELQYGGNGQFTTLSNEGLLLVH